MFLAPDSIIQCPFCSFQMRKLVLISGNTFRAVRWSDSKLEAPMLPYPIIYTVCSECHNFFRVKDAEVVWKGENDDDQTPEGYDEIERIRRLQPLENDRMLKSKLHYTPEEEKNIRREIWWGYHDRIRMGMKMYIATNDEALYHENALKLLAMMDEEDHSDRLLKAELFRNIGEFGKCLELLDGIEEKLAYAAQQIREACESGKREVIRIRE